MLSGIYMPTQFSNISMYSIFLIYLTLWRTSWLTLKISVVILRFSCNTLGLEVQHFWYFTKTVWGKSPVGFILVIVFAILLDHIFQTMNSKTFYSKQNELHVDCEEVLQPEGNNTLWRWLSFWPDCSVHHSTIFHSSPYFIINVIRTSQSIGVHSTPDCYFCTVRSMVLNIP